MYALLSALLLASPAPWGPSAAAGDAALAAGDAAQALVYFEQALAITPHPALTLGRARALGARRETCGAARDAFREFFAECQGCTEHPQGLIARNAALRRCGATLVLTSDPKGADFELDGVPVEPPVRTWAGPVRLTARWTGHGARTRADCVRPGQVRVMHLTLDGDARAVPHAETPSRQADLHTAAALSHRQAGAYCAEVLELDTAHRAQPEPLLRYQRAKALERDLRRCAQALEEYDAFLAGCRFCSQREDARQSRARLSYRCAGRLTVTGPPGAALSVDGPPPPHGDARRIPGRYRVSATAEGYHPFHRTIPIEAGHDRALQVKLRPLVPPAPPGPVAASWWKWAALGAGLAATGAGVYGATDGDNPSVAAGGLALGPATLGLAGLFWWSEAPPADGAARSAAPMTQR
jgi:hypothetical protein